MRITLTGLCCENRAKDEVKTSFFRNAKSLSSLRGNPCENRARKQGCVLEMWDDTVRITLTGLCCENRAKDVGNHGVYAKFVLEFGVYL